LTPGNGISSGILWELEKVTDGLFEREEAVLHVIERIVAPLGLRVDESSPCVDARLSDGSRVQIRFLRT
jgi:Flp pilus assembly CpaF family ATPase